MKRILFVCLGNICRSPLAEGMLRKKLAEKNIDIQVDSAGTFSWNAGNPPDQRSIQTASKFGVDISGLKSRHFTENDFKDFDLILAMDKNNMTDVLSQALGPADVGKVQLCLNFAGTGVNAEVPDPYFGTMEDFTNLYYLLDKACDQMIIKLMHA